MIALAIFFKWFGLFLGILAIIGLGVVALAWWNDRRAARGIARTVHTPWGAWHYDRAGNPVRSVPRTNPFTRHRIQP